MKSIRLLAAGFTLTLLSQGVFAHHSTNGIYVRAKRVRRRMLNDGDVVQIGQHEIMYFDERLSRTRVLAGEGEDDAVPLVQELKAAPETVDDEGSVAPLPIRADRK